MSAFKQLANKLASQGVKNPGGLAYAIGAKKYGAKTMAKASAKGESAKAVQRQSRGK